ncbi:hypothetical protein [Larkinella soli]|uniref:hypothetical protein n=1 Tax=Larkinella soli TaxID=1770527 RepID=UPI000FFC5B26|nr:hypothetical protein [Larkinella soli]
MNLIRTLRTLTGRWNLPENSPLTETEKFKQEQRTRLNNYQIGGKDSYGNTISTVYGRGNEYVIYGIEAKNIVDSVRIWVDPETEEDKNGVQKKFDAVRIQYTHVKGLLFKTGGDPSYKTRIAHILAHALTVDPDESNAMFGKLADEINENYQDLFNNRIRYLLSSLAFTLLNCAVAVLVFRYPLLLPSQELHNLVYVAAGGSLGGFISISRRLNQTTFEKGVNKYLYIVYGIERIIIAVFGATIIYFAIRTNLLFGIANKAENPQFAYLIFAIVAGFSETLVPNLLIKLESDK